MSKPPLHFQGEWVNMPRSWFIRKVENGGGNFLSYTSIGEREWAALADDQLPIHCSDWQQQPADTLTHDACAIATEIRPIVEGILGLVFQEVEAEFVPGITDIDNIPCYEYSWQDTDGNHRLYVIAENGLPLEYEDTGMTLRFSQYNAPSNAIIPPTSEMPQRLYLDDARMALNSLASFRYITTAELVSETTSSPTTEGVYVQANQAWSAKWSVGNEVEIDILVVGNDTWASMTKGETWLPIEVYENLYEGMNNVVDTTTPFWLWPDSSKFHNGILQSETTRTVNGMECHEYLFLPIDTSLDSELQLCVTPNEAIPIQFDLSAQKEGFSMHIVREINQINESTNIVAPP